MKLTNQKYLRSIQKALRLPQTRRCFDEVVRDQENELFASVFKRAKPITQVIERQMNASRVSEVRIYNLHNLQTFESYDKHKANANLHPCFVYTNIRSVNNKHEEISDFLQQQNRQTCFIVTETLINDNQKIPLNF